MDKATSYELRRQVICGLAIIGVGAIFLFDRFDLFDADALWHYAPLVLVAFGVNGMIGYPTGRHFVRALGQVFIGLWLYAVLDGSFGLTFRNSWPLFIIWCGIGMIVRPVVEKR